MSVSYKEYLAANVLNDDGVVSYRLLSRALKVSCNEAKCMLFDFHRTQSARNPSSIHATYLIAGTRRFVTPEVTVNGHANSTPNGTATNFHDSFPLSSAPASSPPEDLLENANEIVPESAVLLVGQENLDSAKADFETIKTIHVYSLEPGPLPDHAILSDCNRKVTQEYASENRFDTWKTYGTIHNPRAKRRALQVPTAPVPETKPATAGMRAAPPKQNQSTAVSDTKNPRSGTETHEGAAPMNKLSVTGQKSASNSARGNTIMNSFSKTQAPRTSNHQDAPMKDVADDEGEDLALDPQASEDARSKAEISRKAKQDREDQLRKMMEDDDTRNVPAKHLTEEDHDEEMSDDSDTAANATGDSKVQSQEASQDNEEIQQPAPAGRRRGRRKVIKKKTVKDAEGYLVTREEEAWESFSEDEASQPPKASLHSSRPPSSTSKSASAPRSSGTKKGQGNIMKFFGKG